MANTVSSTLVGTFVSVARDVAATHNTASVEVWTIRHRLGACPDVIYTVLKTVTAFGMAGLSPATGTGNGAQMALRSWNASTATFDGALATGGAAGSPFLALFDVICEVKHSYIK